MSTRREKPPIPPDLYHLYLNDTTVHAALAHYLAGAVSLERALIAAVVGLATANEHLRTALLSEMQQHMAIRVPVLAGGQVLRLWTIPPPFLPWSESYPTIMGGPLDVGVPLGAVVVQPTGAPEAHLHEAGLIVHAQAPWRPPYARDADEQPPLTTVALHFRPLRGVLSAEAPAPGLLPKLAEVTGWLRTS